jgi:2-polyprenyl-3-methyl-5-hydroxy-6-metoxy-1,4-benzoquinol methylase
MNGGYDDGYRECPCFWGNEPGSLIRVLSDYIGSVRGFVVLDAGCGEGKNAAFLAARGAVIDAFDISVLAIQNGRRHFADRVGIRWKVSDVREIELPKNHYDVVVAYGLLHCLPCALEVRKVILRLQDATRSSGYNVICAFNDRRQELHAHPGFSPSLLSHAEYMAAYASWEVLKESDSDLTERHPNNNLEHTHSMTRILARKVLL